MLPQVMTRIGCLSVRLCVTLGIRADLFQGALSVKEFMWQQNMSGVAVYVGKCLKWRGAAVKV